MQQAKWFERNFEFNITQNIFPSIIERLEGTALRLENKMASIPADILEIKPGNTWSIKEHIGHLTDLEPLWQLRLDDIRNGQAVMTAADLQNEKTSLANHNAKSIDDLLKAFRKIRQTTLNRLEDLDEATVFKAALHPRLNKPMRTIDLFIFVAEHDDHHLSRITEIYKQLKKSH